MDKQYMNYTLDMGSVRYFRNTLEDINVMFIWYIGTSDGCFELGHKCRVRDAGEDSYLAVL